MTMAPLSTVKSRLYRGLAALKPEMETMRSTRRLVEARGMKQVRERLSNDTASELKDQIRSLGFEDRSASTGLSASARASMVNRTHRVVRERAQTLNARRILLRSLWFPMLVCSAMLVIVCWTAWTVFAEFESVPSGMPESGDQSFVLLLWFLPISATVLGCGMDSPGRAAVPMRTSLDDDSLECEARRGQGWTGTRQRTEPDSRMGGGGGGSGLCRGAVPVHHVLPHSRHEMLPMRLLTSYSWGTGAGQLCAAGRLCEPRRKAAQHVRRVVDVDCGHDAGRHRRGGVLPAAAAGFAALPALPDGDLLHLPLLPAVPVPTGSGVRTLLPRRQDDGRLLHPMRARPGRGPCSGEAARV